MGKSCTATVEPAYFPLYFKVAEETYVLKVDLDVDSNRSGVVEGTDAEDATEMSSPAIMVVNDDDDDMASGEDFTDNIVNGATDANDLARLFIRSVPVLPPGGKVVLSVSSSDAQRIRIFNAQQVSVIGPGQSEYEIPDVSAELAYGIEAREYASSTFSGTVVVALIVKAADGTEAARDEVTLKVAPFILLPGGRPAEKVYVTDKDVNGDETFANQLGIVLGPKMERVPRYWGFYGGTGMDIDPWLQDAAEIGYVQYPPNASRPSVLSLPRIQGLASWPCDKLRGPDFGYLKKGALPARPNEGGNLECTPPISGSSFGRVVVSTAMEDALTKFIEDQGVQTPLVRLNLDWLTVGHVDEVVAFLPAAGDRLKVLIADPNSAINLLSTMNVDDDGAATSGSATELEDQGKSWAENEWQDGIVSFAIPPLLPQVRQIASSSANSISILPITPFDYEPTIGVSYQVVSRSAYLCMFCEGAEDLGVVSEASSTKIYDATKNWVPGDWNDGTVRIVEGTGHGRVARVGLSTEKELWLENATWSPNETPDTTSRYIVVKKSKFADEVPAITTAREVLNDQEFLQYNLDRQSDIDSNVRSTLKSALSNISLTDADFIEIPTLFENDPRRNRARAYMPSIVNMLIDGTTLVVAKPFGPRGYASPPLLDRIDIFEWDIQSKLGEIGYSVSPIDDWSQYHLGGGEIHCGTNARRTAPTDKKWWE